MKSKIAKKILSETPEEVKIFVRRHTDIVVRIHELMQSKGLTQKDLAERMDKKPSEINKWLKGNHNLTLKTIARLEAELGGDIIYTASSKRRKQSA
jgi:transcriptional regulator with XRE-family HTH domain